MWEVCRSLYLIKGRVCAGKGVEFRKIRFDLANFPSISNLDASCVLLFLSCDMSSEMVAMLLNCVEFWKKSTLLVIDC